MMYRSQSIKSFTLLEMLLVVMIMGLTTGSLLMTVNRGADQARYDTTREKSAMIKEAIIGYPGRYQNGSSVIRSFVADLGRYPATLTELFDRGAAPALSYNSDTHLRFGWNGPYLNPTDMATESTDSGEIFILDDWGNFFTYNNAGTTASIISKGKDMADGGTEEFEQDETTSINANECVTLPAGEKIQITAQISGLTSADTSLKIIYPDNTENIPAWGPDIETADSFTTTFSYQHSSTQPLYWRQLCLAVYDTSGAKEEFRAGRVITLTPGASPATPRFTITIMK